MELSSALVYFSRKIRNFEIRVDDKARIGGCSGIGSHVGNIVYNSVARLESSRHA